jgi:hypothetical protein
VGAAEIRQELSRAHHHQGIRRIPGHEDLGLLQRYRIAGGRAQVDDGNRPVRVVAGAAVEVHIGASAFIDGEARIRRIHAWGQRRHGRLGGRIVEHAGFDEGRELVGAVR